MNSKSMINDLTEGPVTKQLLTFAYPFILSNLLQTLYNIVDMIVVGQFVGSAGLSAVSIGGDILTLCTHLCMGFTGAAQIMVAQYVGIKDIDGVKKTIGTLFSSIILIALAFMAVGLIFTPQFLSAMKTPAEALSQAKDYSYTCFAGMVFIFGYNAVSAVLRGMGDSKRPFLFIAIAAFSNLVLDLLFVCVFNLSVFGAALATVMGQAISFVMSIVYLYRRRDRFAFDFRPASFRPDKAKLRQLMNLGLPMALQHAAISLSMMYINSLVNAYGLVASAVTGIGNKLRIVISIITNALSTAVSSMVGQNIAARKTDRVRSIILTALLIDCSFCVIMCACVLIFPTQIFSLFNTDPEVLAWAPKYMVVCAVSYTTFALMSPFLALINGLGHAALGFIIAIIDGVIARIGLSLLLGNTFGLGIWGFWFGNAAAGYVTVIIAFAYYLSGRWKTRKLLIQQ